ncbi:M16 peptidase-like protein [Aureococcus anophagefferens]|nr:M16 peptidase-like protein [Aureococcus anophagefferens]
MAAVALLALVVSATLSLKPSALGPRRTGVGSVVRSVRTALRTSTISEAVEIVLDDADIERPAVDRRRYRLVRLANGVEALLVSDGDADEAGARCPSRPAAGDTRLGLAHFHEHMLFLGTRKYPDEDEYEAYLNAHGGGSNAWTAGEACYYLNVSGRSALDRLAQFFVDPLLSLDCVEREVKAVDSEYAMALQDDGWRMLSVLKATANGAPRSTARASAAEKRSADTASDLADALWDHPTQPLSGPSLAGTFDEEAVRVVLDALTPENSVVFDARKHATDGGWTREPWHGATYRSDRTGDDDLSPSTTDDRAGVYRLPGTGRATVWRRADLADAPPTVPKVPKVMVAALFREAEKHTARSLAATKAIGNTVFALMNHEAYDASLAGLSFSVDASRAGFVLRSSGFSDKARDALELAATKLRELVAKSDFTDAERKLFESEKEELARRCSDSTRDEPSSLVTTWSRYAMDGDADALDVDALGAALADDSFDHGGNADDAGARAYAAAALAAVADPGPTEPWRRTRAAAPRGDFGVAAAEPSDPNNAVEMYWQLGRSGDDDDAVDAGWPSAAKRDAAATLLGRLAQASAFNRLRTVEQLGYIASAGLDSSGGVIGFTCLLQSATGKSPPELEDRVEAWLAVFAQELRDLSDADLALKREGLATEILQRPASLRDVRRLFRSRVYSPDLAADAPADAAPAAASCSGLDELRAFKRGRDLGPPAKVWDEGGARGARALRHIGSTITVPRYVGRRERRRRGRRVRSRPAPSADDSARSARGRSAQLAVTGGAGRAAPARAAAA